MLLLAESVLLAPLSQFALTCNNQVDAEAGQRSKRTCRVGTTKAKKPSFALCFSFGKRMRRVVAAQE